MNESLKLLPIFLLCSSLATAQEPLLTQPQSIPTDLALALANAGGFGSAGEPQILVGSIPEWVTAKVKLPENWRVLGSAFAGTTFVGVLHVATNSDSLVAEFDKLQTPLEWKVPPPPYRPVTQGFQFLTEPAMPGSGARADQRITRCGDGQVLTVWVSRARSLSSTIVFRLVNSTQRMGSACSPYRPPPGMEDEGPRMPTLYMPAGVTRTTDQTCWLARHDTRGSGTSAEIKSTMAPEALLEHLSRQLEDSGWTRAPGLGRMISRSWTRPDDSTATPKKMSIEVQVYPQDTTCRSVNLMMYDRARQAEIIRR